MKYLVKISGLILFVLSIFLFNSCKKDKPTPPSITTSDVTAISSTYATSGGNVTNEGSSAVLSMGICWSKLVEPTITDNKTTDSIGLGAFTSNLTQLTPNTLYYVRAYATNSFGTGYGEALSFTTLDPAKAEDEIIQEFINKNPTFSFQLKPSGLYYLDLIIGTGPVPVAHDTAYVQYTGYFLNGNVFDTNIGAPDLVFPVGEGYMISGFDEGITYMREGGKAVFLMPSKLAYGSAGYYSIPGYTPLLFEVNLVKVKKR